MIRRRPGSPIRFALIAATLVQPVGCDSPEPPEHPAPKAAPAAAPGDVRSDSYLSKLAALRHLMEDQPLAQDHEMYAAYLIKGTPEEAKLLAETLRDELSRRSPPITAAGGADTYLRKGRLMDRATGKPLKVFQARIVEPSAAGREGAITEPRTEVRAWWQSGRFAGQAYRYQLRKSSGKWVVAGRSPESI